MIFSVAYIENPYWLSRGWYLYVYIYINKVYVEFLASHFRDLSCCISKFTGWAIIEELSICRWPRTFRISWGQKNACKILLCWFIVMVWVMGCNDMYRYERHFGFFYRNRTILETVSNASQCVNTENRFIEIQRQGILLASMCFC